MHVSMFNESLKASLKVNLNICTDLDSRRHSYDPYGRLSQDVFGFQKHPIV